MNLLLWRHAEAEDGGPDLQSDLARRLTPRGRKQAQHVATWLKRHLPPDTHILVSPAQRTRQTADALGLPYTVEPRIAPGAPIARVLDVIAQHSAPLGQDGTLVVVGHQPWVGQVIAAFLNGSPNYWSVRKAQLWWLVRRVRDGEEQWALQAVTNPDLL